MQNGAHSKLDGCNQEIHLFTFILLQLILAFVRMKDGVLLMVQSSTRLQARNKRKSRCLNFQFLNAQENRLHYQFSVPKSSVLTVLICEETWRKILVWKNPEENVKYQEPGNFSQNIFSSFLVLPQVSVKFSEFFWKFRDNT